MAALSVLLVFVDVVEAGARGVEEAEWAACLGIVHFHLGELPQWLSQRREPLAPLQFRHCRGFEVGRPALLSFRKPRILWIG
jgi:hypothetical protein